MNRKKKNRKIKEVYYKELLFLLMYWNLLHIYFGYINLVALFLSLNKLNILNIFVMNIHCYDNVLGKHLALQDLYTKGKPQSGILLQIV